LARRAEASVVPVGSDLTLQVLQSADTQDGTRVEVRADLQTDGRKDALLEQMVARLSL
jgi:hypothetical protein